MSLHHLINLLLAAIENLFIFLFFKEFSGTATLVTGAVAYLVYRHQTKSETTKALELVKHELKATCLAITKLKTDFSEASKNPHALMMLSIMEDMRTTRHWEQVSNLVAPVVGIENTGRIDTFYSTIVAVERICQNVRDRFFQIQNQSYIERENTMALYLYEAAKNKKEESIESLLQDAQQTGATLTTLYKNYQHDTQLPGTPMELLTAALNRLHPESMSVVISKIDISLDL